MAHIAYMDLLMFSLCNSVLLCVTLCKFLILSYTENHGDHSGHRVYFLNILPKNIFISFHESLSAWGLYSMGILNFLPVAVEAGLVNA